MTTFLITGVNHGIGVALKGWGDWTREQSLAQRATGRVALYCCPWMTELGIAKQLVDLPAVDVLINNAGVIGPEPDEQTPLNIDWDGFLRMLTVNTLAPLAVAQAVLPQLRESAAPKILSMSSQMAWMGYRKPTQFAYRASKSALNEVMQGLTTSLEPEGIPVALVDPGWVRTDMEGVDANEDPAAVAAGTLDIAPRLTANDTGMFFRFTGEERDF